MRCGVGDYSCRLAEQLASEPGVTVAVLTSVGARVQGSAVEVLAVVRTWGISGLPRVASAIRKWKPDVVHIQIPTQGYRHGILPSLIPCVSALLGARVVQTWHEYMCSMSLREAAEHILRAMVRGGLVVVRPDFVDNMLPRWRWVARRQVMRLVRSASSIPRVSLDDAERRELRLRYGAGEKRLVVHFGFVYEKKGAHLVFDIVDPGKHHVVITGMGGELDEYQTRIKSVAESEAWSSSVTLLGFLEGVEVARLLAAADAVLLPFTEGSGTWNTSLLAAQQQGSFVVTTSRERSGYASDTNTYSARPGDVREMREALDSHSGTRAGTLQSDCYGWSDVARAHLDLYRLVVRGSGSAGAEDARHG
jgi:glycosyltransferase involved in cell wall biosynthesis